MSDKEWKFDAFIDRVIDGDTVAATIYLRLDDLDLGFGISTSVPEIEFKAHLRIRNVDTHETFGVTHDSEEYAKGLLATAFTEQWVLENGPYFHIQTFKRSFERYEADIFAYGHPYEADHSLAKALIDAGFDKTDA